MKTTLLCISLLASSVVTEDATVSLPSTNRRLDELLNFEIGNTVEVDIDTTTDPTNWAIGIRHGYPGFSEVSKEIYILDKDCVNDKRGGAITVADPPVTTDFTSWFQVHLNIDAFAVKSPDSPFWFVDGNDNTKAELAFCTRVEILYSGVLVNFAKTKVSVVVENDGEIVSFEREAPVDSANTFVRPRISNSGMLSRFTPAIVPLIP